MKRVFVIALLSTATLALSAILLSQTQSSTVSPVMNSKDVRIEIRKNSRTLTLFDGKKPLKTYDIVLGFSPIGDKEVEGDGKTPEGRSYVFAKNPESKFHLSLGLSYPSIEDAERGIEGDLISKAEADSIVTSIKEKGMPLQKTNLGGEIYIHGGGISNDWTDGCIALDNREIEELFNLVAVGTVVDIYP